MAGIRGQDVKRPAKGQWFWLVGTVRWGFWTVPRCRLWRGGTEMPEAVTAARIQCVDDAVLFSLGYESCYREYSFLGGVRPAPEERG